MRIYLSFGSYLESLFTIENTEAGSFLASLPILITAVALGVILAGVLFAFWRATESALLEKLTKAEALTPESGKTLTELGYTKKTFSYRLISRLLRSPSCILYKTISCPARDSHIAAMEERVEQGNKGEKRPKKSAPLGFSIDEDTRFYILPDKVAYATSKGGTFKADDYMNLLYATLLCVGIWFVLLNVLDPIVAFLGG